MKKVLITGNRNYGLCKSICNLFDTVDDINYTTVSRSNGWNLDVGPEQKRLADYFVDNKFDIFINNSAIWKFHQIMIADSQINLGKAAATPPEGPPLKTEAKIGVARRTPRPI